MNRKQIWVEAKCDNYYKFIEKIKYVNINIYDIKYENKKIYLKLENDDFEKLKKYIVSYKFKKNKDLGINSIINFLKIKKIYVLCLIVGLIFFYFLSNVIVKINIVHENKEIREIIKEELENYGIKVLSFKKKYSELDKIRQEILDKYPDKLDWMEFEVKGMVINVKVEERIITNIEKEDKVCDLIATKSGVINDILVNEGELLVNLNDYVNEGDVLVRGTIKYNEEDKRYTCASGKVYATVWYTANISIPFYYYEYEKTGKTKYNLVWEVDGNKKRVLKERFSSYDSSLINIFKIFDFNLYIEKEEETKKIVKEYSEKEAINVGVEKAIESINIKLGEFDEIIDKKVLKKTVNDSKMDIEVFIIVKELISTTQEVTVEKNEEGNE